MKRMILAVLLVSALLSVSAATAEPCEQPIQFRGLKWGGNYSDIAEGFKIIRTIGHYDNSCTIRALMYGEASGNAKYDERVGFKTTIDPSSIGKVGGYPVKDAGMFFAHTMDESGRLLEENESAKFYMGFYMIEVKGKSGQDAAWDDLTQKLSSLYGECDQEVSPWNTYRVWDGAEGTMVSLEKVASHNGEKYSIIIRYSFEAGETLLQKAQSAIDHEFSLITDGL